MTDEHREVLLRLVEQQGSLGGRFSKIHRLAPVGGDGTFSLMFTALDSTTGDRVAIKVFHPECRDPYRKLAFYREEALLRQFQGEHSVIQLRAPLSAFKQQLETDVGLPYEISFEYFALELASGDAHSVLYSGVMSAIERLEAFHAMCRGTQRLHLGNVVHRDLKLRNFLMRRDVPVVSDLGTSRNLSDPTQAIMSAYSAPPGDRRYTGPELLAGLHDVDPAIALIGDFYSLGTILFELFAGTPLFPIVYDTGALDALSAIGGVDRAVRLQVFHEVVPDLAQRRLPSVAEFSWAVPSSICGHIDELYRSLASLDYRHRNTAFERVFGRLAICLKILRNERAYQAWLAEKRKRRAVREARAGLLRERVAM
jgi:serine/threonine protein kinase